MKALLLGTIASLLGASTLLVAKALAQGTEWMYLADFGWTGLARLFKQLVDAAGASGIDFLKAVCEFADEVLARSVSAGCQCQSLVHGRLRHLQ